RQNVDLKWRRKEKDIKRLSQLQLFLLKTVCPYLKRNGVLLYVTCTLTKEENERIVEKFLNEFKNFRLQNIADHTPQYAPFCQKGIFQTLPYVHNLEGFFAALFYKVDD
ncbi:MAG TPA: 16S rRNA (cytosine(967)-C(5))-methyltransferase, partial [Candidatus Desulfofervidus auxilii]|nr:16S rRNA (cytosine(967)-C(5))-methyltransferase [Candidatus Desulfofervidus auxilii]